MRTETIEHKIYTFNELSEDAKAKARDWYREGNSYDSFYSECVIEDAKEAAACFGLDIDKVYFSGFWSQGDGACFEGRYRYKAGWREALKAYAPKDETLQRIGEALQHAQRKHFYTLEANTKHRGHYYHSGCMSIEVENREERGRNIGYQETEISDALRGFADWIYRRLEEDYDYHNSDEAIDETIEANGYEFTEDGARY